MSYNVEEVRDSYGKLTGHNVIVVDEHGRQYSAPLPKEVSGDSAQAVHDAVAAQLQTVANAKTMPPGPVLSVDAVIAIADTVAPATPGDAVDLAQAADAVVPANPNPTDDDESS